MCIEKKWKVARNVRKWRRKGTNGGNGHEPRPGMQQTRALSASAFAAVPCPHSPLLLALELPLLFLFLPPFPPPSSTLSSFHLTCPSHNSPRKHFHSFCFLIFCLSFFSFSLHSAQLFSSLTTAFYAFQTFVLIIFRIFFGILCHKSTNFHIE